MDSLIRFTHGLPDPMCFLMVCPLTEEDAVRLLLLWAVDCFGIVEVVDVPMRDDVGDHRNFTGII